jgi:hypothetical protein
MQQLIDFVRDNWVQITVIYLAFVKFITVIRDAIDKTPGVDTNWFERLVTILEKTAGSLLLGQRPK